MMNRRQAIASLSGLSLLGVEPLWAQTLSAQPISLIVPQPAGNPTDILARRLQVATQRELGQAVVVENLPGAGGSLGVNKMLAGSAASPVLMIASQTESILTPLSVRAARYTHRVIGLHTYPKYRGFAAAEKSLHSPAMRSSARSAVIYTSATSRRSRRCRASRH